MEIINFKSNSKMNANGLALILFGIFKCGWCFAITADDVGATEFPFRDAKVKYHHSRYCITAFGDTKCVRMSEEPGNAAKIAKLYKIISQGYGTNSALRMGKEVNTAELSQKLDPTKLSQKVNPSNPTKLSQSVSYVSINSKITKPQQINDDNQHTSQHVIKRQMDHVKPNSSKNVKPVLREFPYKKVRQSIKLSKLIKPKPKWHEGPVPRRQFSEYGRDRSGFLRLNYHV